MKTYLLALSLVTVPAIASEPLNPNSTEHPATACQFKPKRTQQEDAALKRHKENRYRIKGRGTPPSIVEIDLTP